MSHEAEPIILEHEHPWGVAQKQGNEIRLRVKGRGGWTDILVNFESARFEVRNYSASEAATEDAEFLAELGVKPSAIG